MSKIPPVIADKSAIWNYIKTNHYFPSTTNNVPIDPEACAVQNVSDTHHDGLNPDAARKTLPAAYSGKNDDMPEDEYLANYLYGLNKAIPANTKLNDYLTANYECFFRIPLIHGEKTNVGSTGEPLFSDRNSVLETIFDELGLVNQNIYVSKDFGFPAMQYDFTYFKNRQIYSGYRPAQENDAAGKPTLASSKAFEFGFQSPNIKVDFIWTNPTIDDKFTHLSRWTGGAPPETPVNYSLLDYDTIIRWDPNKPGPSANDLKSQTFFIKPIGANYSKSIVYQSNSEWTSKSGKELKAYQQFNNGTQEILNKNPLALGNPITSANKAITATNFDEFHTLAKRSGDALTAYIKPQDGDMFTRLNPKSTNGSGPYDTFSLNDFAFMYQTHDRLAAAGALTRKVEMVILESPRESGGDSVFSLFIRKDKLNVKQNYDKIKELYYGSDEKPYAKLIAELKSATPETITKIDTVIRFVDPTWISSVYDNTITIENIKTQTNNIVNTLTSAIPEVNNDSSLVLYIQMQILMNTITNMSNEIDSLKVEHIDITSFFNTIIANAETPEESTINPDAMNRFIAGVVFPFNEYKSCMKTHKALNAVTSKINSLPLTVTELISKIGGIANVNVSIITALSKIKPISKINATSQKRITGRFNPLKLFATSKDRLNILLSSDLQEFFGFPELLLKLWDKLPDEAFPVIYNYYNNAYNGANSLSISNPSNHDLELITQCLGFVFSEPYTNLTMFKDNLMEFAQHKELLLTEKKTNDDFMFELPAMPKLLSKKKMITN